MALKSGLVAVKDMLESVISASATIDSLWEGRREQPETGTLPREAPEPIPSPEFDLEFEGIAPRGSSAADGSGAIGERSGQQPEVPAAIGTSTEGDK
jgi:hypothetical protein